MSRIIMIDAALEAAVRGHHQQLTAGYVACVGAERCMVAAHKSVGAIEALRGVRTIAAFQHSFYDLAEQARLGRIGRFFQAAAYSDALPLPAAFRRFLQGLARLRRDFQPVVVPPEADTRPASPYEAELAGLLTRLSPGPGDHLVFLSLDKAMCEAIEACIAPYRDGWGASVHLRIVHEEDACDRLVEAFGRQAFGQTVHLYGETADQAARLSRRLGVHVDVAPYPAPALPDAPPLRNRPLTVAYFGEARAEKGFALLEPIVQSFMQRHPDLAGRVRWRFQAGGRSPEATAARDRVRAAQRPKGADIVYHFGVLSMQAYRDQFVAADIVLAPQSPEVYAVRGSGIAREAVAGGRPLVCLAGSSLAAEGRGAVASAGDVEGLAHAIAAIVRDPEPWFERARLGARAAHQELEQSALIRRLKAAAP